VKSRFYNHPPMPADDTQPKVMPADGAHRGEHARSVPPLAVTIADLMPRVSISRSEAYRLLAGGKLQAVKSGTRTLVLWDSVLAYIESLPAAEFTAPGGTGR
jgi:hypothetical protein